MKKFLLGTILLAVALFAGMLFGVQYIQEETGLAQPEPLVIDQKSELNIEKEMRQEQLLEKKERVRQIGYFNFFSDFGEWLAKSINGVSRAILTEMISFWHHLTTGE